jgi:hypothetical protein
MYTPGTLCYNDRRLSQPEPERNVIYPLAHGALGPYDELIYLGVAVIFLIMMGVSWFQTRMTEYDDDQRSQGSAGEVATDSEKSDERFTLD